MTILTLSITKIAENTDRVFVLKACLIMINVPCIDASSYNRYSIRRWSPKLNYFHNRPLNTRPDLILNVPWVDASSYNRYSIHRWADRDQLFSEVVGNMALVITVHLCIFYL